MPSTPKDLADYIAADLITAKSNGRTFQRTELADFIRVSIEAYGQANPSPDAVSVAVEPVKIDAEAIYQAYPRKVGKKAAIKAIESAIKTGQRGPHLAAEYMLEAVQAYAAAVATWPAKDREFVPHPATWFNRGSYLDDPREWQAKGARTVTTDQPRDYSKL